eukprot:TRINITY_DN5698_c0_g1_i3.p1 TRINITY_DN5698_c0_g1~~TRINITY_DN5698_c0_g1_i3.p1  ORF type:complete len:378 (-),score=39.40 TRINITY_DN5698_c0_g1_i3:425-1558(-)
MVKLSNIALTTLSECPKTEEAFKVLRELEAQVLRDFEKLKGKGGKGKKLTKKVPPDLRRYIFDNIAMQNALHALRHYGFPQVTSTKALAEYLVRVSTETGYQSEIPDRTGFLHLVAFMLEIDHHFDHHNSTIISDLLQDTKAEVPRADMKQALRVLQRTFKERWLADQFGGRLRYSGLGEAVNILSVAPSTTYEWNKRKDLENIIINWIDGLRAQHPNEKQVVRVIHEALQYHFGERTRLHKVGSKRRRTDIPSSDMDLHFETADEGEVTWRQMEGLVKYLDRTTSFSPTLDKKALKVMVTITIEDECYEIVPRNPTYFEYHKESFPRTRGSDNRSVNDVEQNDYLFDAPHAQRAVRSTWHCQNSACGRHGHRACKL